MLALEAPTGEEQGTCIGWGEIGLTSSSARICGHEPRSVEHPPSLSTYPGSQSKEGLSALPLPMPRLPPGPEACRPVP